MELLALKRLSWILRSLQALRNFPKEARSKAGSALMAMQLGKPPPRLESIRTVGPGAIEIRIHKPHEHRVIYIVKFSEALYVLDCFEKKTRATSQKDLNIARRAYAQMQQQRGQ